jgi:hypothetical protein
MGKQQAQHLMNTASLDKLLLRHFGCDKIEKMKMPKQSQKG